MISISMITTIGLYSGYKVLYLGEHSYIPIWYNSNKPKPLEENNDLHINIKQLQSMVEDQLLEKLSLDKYIQFKFKLPIKLDKSIEFKVWTENRNPSFKCVKISLNKPYFKVVDTIVETDNEPFMEKFTKSFSYIKNVFIGRKSVDDDDFKVHIYNENGEGDIEAENLNQSNFDILFLGTVPINNPHNGMKGEIVYKGIYSHEHLKFANIEKAHLILMENGKKVRKFLW